MTFVDSPALPGARPEVSTVQVGEHELGTEAERTALRECEAKIQVGLSTFVEVGNALMEIRDGKLYRETHGTFEDYCREKWGMSKTYATRLIQAHASASNLVPIGTSAKHIAPTSESQVRPLAHLTPEQQKEVWAKAVEIGGGKPTAKDVQKAVVEVVVPAEKRAERPPKFTPDFGWDIWVVAKNKLEQIAPNDLSRERALNDALNYITGRLEGKR